MLTDKKIARYDILVIGGGPAGLMAARKAAQKGVKTLLIEKGKQFGLKVCGEAVSTATFAEAEVPPSENFVCGEEIDRVFVYAPEQEKKVEICAGSIGYDGGYILNKRAFLEEMAKLAFQAGAEVWTEAIANQLLRHNGLFRCVVATNKGEQLVEAKIVMGCDGVNSLVARRSFNRKAYRVISCVQYQMDNCHLIDQRALEIFVGNNVAPDGYVWIFPKGKGLANVGIGTQGAPARRCLDRFIKTHPHRFKKARVLKMGAAPVPIGGQVEEVVQDGLMLCGDAAGQVIPLTGAGIHSGIAAGKIAGEVAAEALLEGNTSREKLSAYPRQFNKVWGKRISDSLKAQQVIMKLSDQELNRLADILIGQDIVDLANGFNLVRVGLKLLKYPTFAGKIARRLLEKQGR
ncbi:MAG: NAD(P)/FAD-dependent oxidoreductase [Candidatus Latescibacteria bacterium]|nr:NAD(P)/FAD-dependent oxidoreductase [Candidatus Latescibacterota bacterium]